MRQDNRRANELRPLSFVRRFTRYAPGSVLVSFGHTKVLCTATIDNKVPPFLKDSGKGWITAEYSMLPSATHTRNQREVSKGKPSGRTNEIQRLIGRSLRSAVDLGKLGERTIYVDCDVIQADGGTRTAAITGSVVALYDAILTLVAQKTLSQSPFRHFIAAVSVGMVDGIPTLDLAYDEDSRAEVDMNIVMDETGKFIEIQGTAESQPYSADELQDMLRLGDQGIRDIIQKIRDAVSTT